MCQAFKRLDQDGSGASLLEPSRPASAVSAIRTADLLAKRQAKHTGEQSPQPRKLQPPAPRLSQPVSPAVVPPKTITMASRQPLPQVIAERTGEGAEMQKMVEQRLRQWASDVPRHERGMLHPQRHAIR